MTPRSLPAVARVLSTVGLEQAKDLAAQARSLPAAPRTPAMPCARACRSSGSWASELAGWGPGSSGPQLMACQGWGSGSSGTEFGLAGD